MSESESLNVIALISGGKDSFFSILHCLRNGHKVVALGNLYPAPGPGKVDETKEFAEHEADLNSFMYQTVGHTVIPLYEAAVRIPLYRQVIVGTAVETALSYGKKGSEKGTTVGDGGEEMNVGEEDETESLVPLLRKIMKEHPGANALCTGAILSTYQRTRIESVALRLGLIPLSYLWKYPVLHPESQTALLQDMNAIGLDARVVKVASGGLDESFLWENVASVKGMTRVEKCMRRFGTDGDGAVLGEGGEFETLVMNGPRSLFKGRIVVEEKDRRVVKEGGGAAWLQIRKARVVMKEEAIVEERQCRLPELLDERFRDALDCLDRVSGSEGQSIATEKPTGFVTESAVVSTDLRNSAPGKGDTLQWTVTANHIEPTTSITQEAENIIEQIRILLKQSSLQAANIISTVIILRSMADFAAINKVYGAVFTEPNPPARVTISSGESMPDNTRIIIHLKVHKLPPSTETRRALHVQSRSYWAPANIGPYSQAISVPIPTADSQDTWVVSIAGQIPLIAHTMQLPSLSPASIDANATLSPSVSTSVASNFNLQTILALQHLWRIGIDTHVSWWTSSCIYFPRCSSLETIRQQSIIAGKAWRFLHLSKREEDEDEEVRDIWEERNFAGMERRSQKLETRLPDLDMVEVGRGVERPPFFAVEVEELPRGSGVEWHAHNGVVGGSIKLFERSSEKGWRIHQCVVSDTVYEVLMIEYCEVVEHYTESFNDALEFLGVRREKEGLCHLGYVDVSIPGLWEAGSFRGGGFPCRSIWDEEGRRLASVLVVER